MTGTHKKLNILFVGLFFLCLYIVLQGARLSASYSGDDDPEKPNKLCGNLQSPENRDWADLDFMRFGYGFPGFSKGIYSTQWGFPDITFSRFLVDVRQQTASA